MPCTTHLSGAFLEPVQAILCATGQLPLLSKKLLDVPLSTVVALHGHVLHSLGQLQLQAGEGREGEGEV